MNSWRATRRPTPKHRLPGFQASGKAHSKHTDTVYHHKGKQ